MLKWLWLTAAIFALDLATKFWVSGALSLYEVIPVNSFFNIVLAHNSGAAFSFLADAGGWQRWFFTAIALLVSVVIVVWLKRLPVNEKLQAVALASILGGALGNVFDRIVHGYVVDFLDFHYKSYHWPAFNVADMAIMMGAALLIWHTIFCQQPAEKSDAK
ncbi:MAG: signal peptidase II [Gammaproteobacteria bacterium]|nr:signal peptidase II [Gammaproteobacteria bacterium]MCF6231094.1 signal peptidase II [Gammaproteobacteria bacterium]